MTRPLLRASRAATFSVCSLVALAAGLPGCTTDVNSRNTIGATRELPALADALGASEAVPEIDRDPGPRTTRLDRGGWQPVEFRVPVDGTVHSPLWRSGPSFDDTPPRQHGLYPTPESALDLGGGACEEAGRGVIEPARAFADLFLMPVYWVVEPAWSREQSPDMYKRWKDGAWLAGPVPEDDDRRGLPPLAPAPEAGAP